METEGMVLTGILLLCAVCAWWLVRRRKKSAEHIVCWSGGDFTAKTGFTFVQLPCSDRLRAMDSQVVDGFIAQIRFRTEQGGLAILRAAVDVGKEISRQTGRPYSSVHRFRLGDTEVTFYHNFSGPQLALWSRDGFRYCLYLPKAEPTVMGGLLGLLVENTRCRLYG